MLHQQYVENWTNSTANLPWGVQRLVHDALILASEGKIRLVHGIDYRDGKPCLFNAIRQMTTQLDDTPVKYAPEVVTAFDDLNYALYKEGVNTEVNCVSEIAATFLVRNFGPLKPAPTNEDLERQALAVASFAVNCTPFIEPTDEEMIADWVLNSTQNDVSTR
jgi:hypothetical protein